MYAVIQRGGKQYRIAVGDVVRVESLPAAAGAEVRLEQVLMLADGTEIKVGNPYVTDAIVTAKVRGHVRGPKVRVFKMRRRKNSRTTRGHRQGYTELEITGIAPSGAEPQPRQAAGAASSREEKPRHSTKRAVQSKEPK